MSIDINVTIDISPKTAKLVEALVSSIADRSAAQYQQTSVNEADPTKANAESTKAAKEEEDAQTEKPKKPKAKKPAKSKPKKEAEEKTPEQEVEEEKDEAPADEGKPLTKEDVRAALNEYAQKYSRKEAIDLLRSTGSQSLKDLDPDKYADLVEKCKQ